MFPKLQKKVFYIHKQERHTTQAQKSGAINPTTQNQMSGH